MKVVIVNTATYGGGAAIAARRLMIALQKSGIDTQMLVRDKMADDGNAVSVDRPGWRHRLNHFRFIWERFVIWATNRFSRDNLFAVSLADTGIDISTYQEIRDADIIHLHWINHGFISLRDIEKLESLGKPIVWTMHDMWPCTGICHHARLCTNYQQGCGNCFFLKVPGKNDLSHRVWLRKKKLHYERIAFVACSQWLHDRAERSSLMEFSTIKSIPNPIDITLFTPIEKAAARRLFSFDEGKFYILFGTVKLSDPRKGGEYFCQAIEQLVEAYPDLKEKIEIVFLGNPDSQLSARFPVTVYTAGYLTDQEKIMNLYNAVDLFVTSSLEENLPNTIMEAMACGTPVVGFETGGIPEMIDHKQNGYVAQYKDSKDLMKGIYWCLWHADYQLLRQEARKKVINCYSEDRVAGEYINLYQSLLEKTTAK